MCHISKEMGFFLIYYFLVIVKPPIPMCEVQTCSREKNANANVQCCTNYFWDKGECKECLPGYFGMNCSSRCVFPYYGRLCQKNCNCDMFDCDHVNGCQGNESEIETTTVFMKSDVSSPKVKSEYSTAQTQFYHDKGNLETEDLRKPVIIVGCVLVFLILVNGLKWISKPIRNMPTIELTREDNDSTTLNLVINERSDQESMFSTMCRIVTGRSCTYLTEVEI